HVVGQAIAAVDEAFLGMGQHTAGGLEVVEEEGRRLVDRLAYRAGRIILAGVAGERVETGAECGVLSAGRLQPLLEPGGHYTHFRLTDPRWSNSARRWSPGST